jgi:hypothetical protein
VLEALLGIGRIERRSGDERDVVAMINVLEDRPGMGDDRGR